MAERVIFHVDANSAFLSWSAAYRVKVLGEEKDLRDVPSVVAGDKASRHSVILLNPRPQRNTESKPVNLFFRHWKNVRNWRSSSRIMSCM